MGLVLASLLHTLEYTCTLYTPTSPLKKSTVGFGMTTGLFARGTNRDFLFLSHSGSPGCPRDKSSLPLRQTVVEGQLKSLCVKILYAFSPANGRIRVREDTITSDLLSPKILSLCQDVVAALFRRLMQMRATRK